MSNKNDVNNFIDNEGNRPNDFSDGLAIATVMLIIIAGAIFYLYSM
ncbi:MAG: hypothetical protein KBD64_07590 [Gammaproteobacteria bacterium]|nr:hypothetical protein [Gammaproteobacteria bacterium]